MDTYMEADVSFGNLHHGLDSSLDESIGTIDTHDLAAVRGSRRTMDVHKKNIVAESQMNLLQDMVLEMKEGFHTALEELAKIQVKEEADANHSKKLQEQQQRQLDHLTEAISDIKHQLHSFTESVEQIKDEQRILKSHLEEVRFNRDSLPEHKVNNGLSKHNMQDDLPTQSEEWTTKFSHLPADHYVTKNVTSRPDREVTATACKSLGLAQALSEECHRFSLSRSSTDEDEDQENLRMSSYIQKTPRHIFEQAADRQHGVSISAGWHDRTNNGGSAAQRQKAVTELADSERDYCSQLWSLLHTYLAPLQTADFLSAEELDMLLPPYLDQMYTEHCHICSELQNRLIHWTSMTSVADLLTRITDSYNSDSLLILYQEYANDLPVALTCLRQILVQSSELRLFLKAIKHSSYQSEDLTSLLLAPVQRIPKYLLQLQEISYHTPSTHADFPFFQAMLHQTQSFVDLLNNKLLNTIEDLSHDGHARSELTNGRLLDSRDSGVHSNITEDDLITSARAFSRRNHVQSEWLENPYNSVHQRQPWTSAGPTSTLSQPDLIIYNKSNSGTTNPQMYTHIPHSQSALPVVSVGGDSGNDVAARQRAHKFQVQKRNPSPAGHRKATQENIPHRISPGIRPSSSVDFFKHSNNQQQYQKYMNNNDSPGQSENSQRPVPQPRPRSALGLHSINSTPKPVVISRRNINRQSKTHETAPETVWDETTTSTNVPTVSTNLRPTNSPTISTNLLTVLKHLPSSNFTAATNVSSASTHVAPASTNVPSRVGHQQPYMAVNDLHPVQPLPHQTPNTHDDDDEEDDTKAKDTTTFTTGRSYPYVHVVSSNNSHEYELHLQQSASGKQSPQNTSLHYNAPNIHDHNFTKPTTNVSRKLYTTNPETTKDDDSKFLKQVGNGVAEPKTSKLKQQPSKPTTNETKDNEAINGQFPRHTDAKAIDKSTVSSTSFTQLEFGQVLENNGQFDSMHLSNDHCFHSDNSLTPVSLKRQIFSHAKQESLRSTLVEAKSNHEQTISNVTDGVNVGGSESISENNKQFLLSLTSKASTVDKTSPNKTSLNKTSSENSSIKNGNECSTEMNGRNSNPNPQSNCDANETLSPGLKKSIARVLPSPPPRSGRAGNSHVKKISVINDQLGKTITKPALPPKKHSQAAATSPVSSQDDTKLSSSSSIQDSTRLSSNMTSSSSPLKHDQHLTQPMSSLSQTYIGLPSNLPYNTPNPSKANPPLSNKQPPGKSNQPFSSLTTGATHVTSFSEAPTYIKRSNDGKDNEHNSISYHDRDDLRSLDMTDFNFSGGKRERRKENTKKELRDEENSTNVDSQLKPNDEEVNVRKKTHFKASFKSLFAKKRFTESDV